MSKDELEKERTKIITNWNMGGNSAHNVVGASLRALAVHNEAFAIKVHQELIDDHGY